MTPRAWRRLPVPRDRRRTPDGGSASIVLLAVGAVVVLGMTAVAAGGQVVSSRHRAEGAADLAALAAASTVQRQTDAAACATARDIAHQNGALLEECAVASDLTVQVVVSRVLTGALSDLGPVRGRARAGTPS